MKKSKAVQNKISWECEKTGEDTAEQETYGETVVLSAGQLSGTASLVSREPGELPTVYLERELTVIGKSGTGFGCSDLASDSQPGACKNTQNR